MMKRVFLVAGTLFVAAAAQAAMLNQLVPEKSQLTFTFRQMNVPVEGSFKKIAAQVNVDPAKPESGKASLEVDLASIDVGSAEGNDEVKGKAWFSTAAFPKATFVATSIKSIGAGRYEARGPLTIKGISRDTAATFTLRNEGAGTWVEGGFALPRLQFKIGEGEWADTGTVADAVQVKFKLFLTTRK